ncbi:MAG: hypothetical protein IJ410_09195 [Oscillospiraceae bacterium]|nr:hypothetical protein [Oscillospiraceae bacterium]
MKSRKSQIHKIKIYVTIISFLLMVMFKSDIDFVNLANNYFSVPLAKEILYDISVGTFSAMILVWLIDEMNARNEEKEEKKRRLVIYRKLKPILNEYYEFYLKLYIATRKEEVVINEKVLKSLNDCKDEFIKQIMETAPFYKGGFYADAVKTQMQMKLMMSNPDNPQEIINMDTSIPWYKCWCYDSTVFYDGIEEIEKVFPDFIPNDLLENIEQLLELVKPLKGINNFIEMKPMADYVSMQVVMMPTEFFLDAYKFIDIIDKLESVIKIVENEMDISIRERDVDFFNKRNIAPILGSACE